MPIIRSLLCALCIYLEILDSRESGWWFENSLLLSSDCRSMYDRWETVKDAPPLSYALTLPHFKVCDELCDFNRAYSRNLSSRLLWELDRSDIILAAIQENDEAWAIWVEIATAANPHRYVIQRRLALQRLVGLEELPPYVPFHRFMEIK